LPFFDPAQLLVPKELPVAPKHGSACTTTGEIHKKNAFGFGEMGKFASVSEKPIAMRNRLCFNMPEVWAVAELPVPTNDNWRKKHEKAYQSVPGFCNAAVLHSCGRVCR
jgi:hypothetical protein